MALTSACSCWVTELYAGLHVDPPLAAIPAILAAAGVARFQTTLRNP